jgi:hypothetical protein
MSYTTRSIIFVLILTTILVVSAIHDSQRIEGFKSKSKDPFKALAKIMGFFTFLGKWFTWIGDILKCSVETIIGLPNCFVFYLFDIFIGTIALFIKLICKFSKTLETARQSVWKLAMKLDKMIYSVTGFHILQYPKSIQKMCYKCKNKKMPTLKK